MATLLISSWVITSMAVCLALFSAAAQRRPRMDEPSALETLEPCLVEPSPMLTHPEAASAGTCMPQA